ncbi:MAG TPA: hypothetical protein VI039_07540 [Solirubrobacterales bacterium]
MKYLKTLGLLILAAAALMAVAASASATQLTSPAGTVYTGSVKAENSTPIVLHTNLVSATCTKSVVEAKVEQHGASTTTTGQVTNFALTECSTVDVFVLKRGVLEFHTDTGAANGNGIATLTGVQITYQITSIFGNIHCIMEGSVTLGTVTGSINTPGKTTAEVPAPTVPDPTSVLCPSAVEWTGTYKFTNPHYLDVD